VKPERAQKRAAQAIRLIEDVDVLAIIFCLLRSYPPVASPC